MKGKLKKWLKDNGKDALGKTLAFVGDNTSIPLVSNIIEGIGESLQNDPELTTEQKAEAAEIVKAELQSVTDRWESDNEQDLKLPKLIRPIVLAYSWAIVTTILVLESCSINIASSALILSMCGSVNIAYFGARTYEKVKNRS